MGKEVDQLDEPMSPSLLSGTPPVAPAPAVPWNESGILAPLVVPASGVKPSVRIRDLFVSSTRTSMITSGRGLSMSWMIFSATAIMPGLPRMTIAPSEFSGKIRLIWVMPRIAVTTSIRSWGVARLVR